MNPRTSLIAINRRHSILGLGAAGALTLTPDAGFAAVRPAAEEALKAERAAASAEGKTLGLFVLASWCPYCKLFNMLLADPVAKAIFDQHFRFFLLYVRERKPEWQKRQLPGAMALFKRYSGGGESVPFFAFLDQDGKALSTSKDPSGQNIGYPTSRSELALFDSMFAKAAPLMSKADIAALNAAIVRLYSPKA